MEWLKFGMDPGNEGGDGVVEEKRYTRLAWLTGEHTLGVRAPYRTAG